MRNSESTQTASKSILMRCGVRCGSYCKSGCEIRKRHAFVFCVCGGGGESGGRDSLSNIFRFQNKSASSWTCTHVTRPKNTFTWQNKGLKYEKSGNMVPYISDFEEILKML